ncbi:MAG: hypothetical protein K0R41_2311 [Geminicoccaceae bacterium]|nr:hypothetical protein [Geminicoccaceae bacterium]MCE3248486.1 hypothetical protein [Geminicoccaceae bacterium]
MAQPQTRRLPRLAPLAWPRLDPLDVWRRRRGPLRNRLGPACGMLLLLGALLWGVGEYASYKAALRQAETNRYLAEFRAPAVADAWQHLSAAWRAGEHRQSALLGRLAERSGSGFDAALRHYQQFVLETVEEHRLAPQVVTVWLFFERLAVCIRVGNCDREVAGAHLRAPLRQFRNQHYYYLESEGLADEFDRVVAQITPDEPWLGARPAAP